MIVGNGFVGSSFKGTFLDFSSDIVVFASGVSNSNETSFFEYERELKLLSYYIRKDLYIKVYCNI